ncbi:hypothetical protein JXL19_12085 [bacterium]|nr:hypothetical protein [bacterium]
MNPKFSLARLSVFITAIIISFSVFSCNKSESPGSNISNTIHKALSWVYGRPANFIEGGFIEMAEEIITFYILGNNAKDASKKSSYIKQIEKRLDFIASRKDFKVYHQEYTMFLALAFISEKLGLKSIDFRKIIEDQLISDPFLYPSYHITTHIWNTVYMERLGYNPPKSLEYLMPKSTLSMEIRQKLLFQHVNARPDPLYIDPISITIYDMTHEIFSLTDFGNLPPPPIIAENQDFFSQLFNRAIEWAIEMKHIDILAELIMSVKILDLKTVPSVQSGIEFIISSQKKDGSFGITNPSRPNVYRHGILVSIMALSFC